MVNCLCLRSCEIHVELLPRAPRRAPRARTRTLCMFAWVCRAYRAHAPLAPAPRRRPHRARRATGRPGVCCSLGDVVAVRERP